MNYERKPENYTFSTTKTAENHSETLFFLHPEQIRTLLPPKSGRGSENARIRMAGSIRKYGVLQPFSVRPVQEKSGFTCYQLVDDEERFRAACLAGIDRIPCKLLAEDGRDLAILPIFAELRAKKLHFLDEAELLCRLFTEYGIKQTEIARRLGASQSSVANKLRLLQLDKHTRESIRQAGLGERHARAILRVPEGEMRQELLEEIVLRRLSVAETEELTDRLLETAKRSPRERPADTFPGVFSCGFADRTAEMVQIREEMPSEGAETGFLHGSDVPNVDSGSTANPAHRAAEAAADISPATSVGGAGAEIRRIQAEIPEPNGILPGKFVLHDLQPLYNSIEKTLSIFRKTGMEVECCREEGDFGVKILICIPKKAAKKRELSAI